MAAAWLARARSYGLSQDTRKPGDAPGDDREGRRGVQHRPPLSPRPAQSTAPMVRQRVGVRGRAVRADPVQAATPRQGPRKVKSSQALVIHRFITAIIATKKLSLIVLIGSRDRGAIHWTRHTKRERAERRPWKRHLLIYISRLKTVCVRKAIAW